MLLKVPHTETSITEACLLSWLNLIKHVIHNFENHFIFFGQSSRNDDTDPFLSILNNLPYILTE